MFLGRVGADDWCLTCGSLTLSDTSLCLETRLWFQIQATKSSFGRKMMERVWFCAIAQAAAETGFCAAKANIVGKTKRCERTFCNFYYSMKATFKDMR